jgi:cytidine deaminase
MAEDRLDSLVAAAREVKDRAYAAYSGFPVGAALIAGDATYVGVNVENASSPVGICAERAALAAAVTAGERAIDAVAVVTDAAEPSPPCGMCRQALWEFGPNSIVISENASGTRLVWALEDLLPQPFERHA